jgi:F0F1-type ATP synthase assembly protein I
MNKDPHKKKWPKNFDQWRKNQAETYKTYIKTSAVGLEFALSVSLGALAGYYLDKRFGWSPYALITGVIIGTIAGIKRLWTFSKSYINKNDDHSS